MTCSILQGINQLNAPVKNGVIATIIHVGILIVLLYGLKTGIYGVVIANMLLGLTICILNGASIARHINYRQEVKKTFLIPGIASVVMGGCSYLVYYLLNLLLKRSSIACLFAVVVAVIVYGVMMLVLHGISERELLSFPMGGRLVTIAKKFHLL